MKDGRCVLSTALWIYLLAIGAADVNAEVHREEYTVGDMDVFALTNGSSYTRCRVASRRRRLGRG